MVIRQGFKIVAVGLAIGTVTALVLVRFVKSILYGVSDYDAITLATSVLVLSFVGFLACLIPARRAMRVDPMITLREP